MIKKNKLTKVICFLLVFSLFIGVVQALLIPHWITGEVQDAADATPADGHTVILYYEGDETNYNSDVIGASGNSGTANQYMIDAEAIPNHSWQVGDILTVKVIDTGDGYITDPVTVETTGANWDQAPNMQLKKLVCDVETFEITVSTDKENYNLGELVNISGSLINSSCSAVIGAEVGLQVKNPIGTTVFVDQLTTDTQGQFTSQFTLPADSLEGEYTVYVSYGGVQGITTFNVTIDSDGKVVTTTGGSGSGCTPVWQCTTWTKCSPERTQTRNCTDKNNCGTTTGKPVESQSCNYVPPRTTTTQEEEKPVEPETISGEGEPAPAVEVIPEKEVNDTGKPNLITGAVIGLGNTLKSGWGIGIIIFLVAAFLLFLYTRKKKQ